MKTVILIIMKIFKKILGNIYLKAAVSILSILAIITTIIIDSTGINSIESFINSNEETDLQLDLNRVNTKVEKRQYIFVIDVSQSFLTLIPRR